MGYTHYWKNETEPSEKTWQKLTQATLDILLHSNIHVAFESDASSYPPSITPYEIRFNGAGNKGHETFLLEKKPTEFSFCKTAQKPYDDIVTAVLILAAHFGPWTITSDGNKKDWEPGLKLVHAVGLTNAEIPIE